MNDNEALLSRFKGGSGKAALIDALTGQMLTAGSADLPALLAERLSLSQVPQGTAIIEQGAGDNDIYFILAGSFAIMVNGRHIADRGPNDCVGEMAATVPSLPRSATVIAREPSVVGKLSASDLAEIGDRFPRVWRELAKLVTRRLYQRNHLVSALRDRITVFIISSSEALSIARAVQNNFAHDPFFVKIWTDGVFRASQYPVESLEAQLDQSDFAIAIAQGDDRVSQQDKTCLTPRDNVIFELGLFVGRLGRQRSFLIEPRGGEIKLPSDLAGIITLPYRDGKAKDLDALLAPACNKLREIFLELGPN